jgi:hypothetical protein
MTPAGSSLVLSADPPVWCGHRRTSSRPTAAWLERRRNGLWARLVVAALTLVAPRAAWAAPSRKAPAQHAVKAEFIERFPRFVEWPASAFASPSSAFVVCIWGQGALSSRLEEVVTRGPIQSRPVRVLRVGSRESIHACHILYVATLDRAVIRGIADSVRGKPILSIGDEPGRAEDGLLVNLIVDHEGFVRFEINLDVARVSGLRISAKLLRLARRVESRR